MIKATYVDHNHASMLGTVLKCPACKHERVGLRGINASTGKSVWFLGCLCPVPAGIVVMRKAA